MSRKVNLDANLTRQERRSEGAGKCEGEGSQVAVCLLQCSKHGLVDVDVDVELTEGAMHMQAAPASVPAPAPAVVLLL